MLKASLRTYLGLAICIAGVAVTAAPALAGVIYDNGPLNGETNGFGIDIGSHFSVANSFTLLNNSVLTGVNLGLWTNVGETPAVVDWLITGSAFGGTLFGAGTGVPLTSAFLTTNDANFDIFRSAFSVPALSLTAGTYWLQLQNGSTNVAGEPLYWDENDGPSAAFQSLEGSPSAALSLVNFSGDCPTCTGSETFQLTSAPEPVTSSTLGAGILAMALASLQRKRKTA